MSVDRSDPYWRPNYIERFRGATEKDLRRPNRGTVTAAPVKVRAFWRCEPCNFDAILNHCPRCGSTKLTRVEA